MGNLKKHVINIKKEKEPKIKLFDFEAFRIITEMLSHDKISFHITSRIISDAPSVTGRYRNGELFLKTF